MGEETQAAMAYPRVDQYEQWKEWAEGMDMSVSEFIQAMVEAGYKKFEPQVEPDVTNEQLRRQRDDLQRQLRDARQRIEELEDQLYRTERETIVTFLQENPGAEIDDIIRHIVDTAPSRIDQHIDMDDRIYAEGDHYYVQTD